jgi:hypothetical protein
MDDREILPLGQHPCDPSKEDIDPIAFSLERLQTLLMWIDEHRSSFEILRGSEPINADTELGYLRDATEQTVLYLQRLTELLLAGYAINPEKRLPKGLSTQAWERLVQAVRRGTPGTLRDRGTPSDSSP